MSSILPTTISENASLYYKRTLEKDVLRRPTELALAKFEKPGSFLSIGCGTLPGIQSLLEKKWKVTGVDCNPVEELIRKRILPTEDFAFIQSSASEAKLGYEKYDLIEATRFFCYCGPESFSRIVNKVYGALKEGGRLVADFYYIPKEEDVTDIRSQAHIYEEEDIRRVFSDFTIETFERVKDEMRSHGKKIDCLAFQVIAQKKPLSFDGFYF